jgi:hypothetical protein
VKLGSTGRLSPTIGQALGRPRAARRERWLRAAAILGPFALAIAVPAACASKPTPSGPGEDCFAATDCQPGLVCVPQKSGAFVCSSDLTQVAGRPPPEAGAADSEAGGDAAASDAPVVEPPDGAGVQDTGTVIPDTGITDTGTGG